MPTVRQRNFLLNREDAPNTRNPNISMSLIELQTKYEQTMDVIESVTTELKCPMAKLTKILQLEHYKVCGTYGALKRTLTFGTFSRLTKCIRLPLDG